VSSTEIHSLRLAVSFTQFFVVEYIGCSVSVVYLSARILALRKQNLDIVAVYQNLLSQSEIMLRDFYF
jgi:hypothetical protein